MEPETEDRWPERALYLADMKAWCKKNGADVKVVAQAIGKAANTVYGWSRPTSLFWRSATRHGKRTGIGKI